MTVKDLIKKLETLDPSIRVFIEGYEGGLADVEICPLPKVYLNVHDKWYYGPHEIHESYISNCNSFECVPGIVIKDIRPLN